MYASCEQLQAAYIDSIGGSDKLSKLSFVTGGGQRLSAEITCAQLYEVDGLSNIYVMPAPPIPPPEEEEEEQEQGGAGIKEKGPVKGFFDDFEEIVADPTTDEMEPAKTDTPELRRPRTRLVTQEVKFLLTHL